MRRVVTATCLAAALLASAACQSTSTATSSSSSGVPSFSASESPLTTSAQVDPAAEATEQVLALVVEYYSINDQLSMDTSLAVGPLAAVVVDPQYSEDVATQQGYRDEGITVTAPMVLSDHEVMSLDLSASPPIVHLSQCVDASGVGAVDASGTSVVSPDRPDYWIADITVVQTVRGDPASWRVSERDDTPVESCG